MQGKLSLNAEPPGGFPPKDGTENGHLDGSLDYSCVYGLCVFEKNEKLGYLFERPQNMVYSILGGVWESPLL